MNRPSFSCASSSPSVGRTTMQNSVRESGSVIAILSRFLRPSRSIMLIAENSFRIATSADPSATASSSIPLLPEFSTIAFPSQPLFLA